VHAFCFISTLQRELDECNLGLIGKIFKGIEVLSLCLYICMIILCLNIIDTVWRVNAIASQDAGPEFPEGLKPSEAYKWQGGILSYCLLEVLIFFAYLLTSLILLVWSRVMSIG
jgi:hypothetical protein